MFLRGFWKLNSFSGAFLSLTTLNKSMPVTINIQQALLRKLALYFYGRSLGFSLKEEDIQVMTWDAQEEFLNLTVNNSRVQKYPVNNNFCRLFFKKLIDQLQPFQDVHDGLFTSLCSVLSSETSDMFCYRHYVIGGDLNNAITIKETNNMVVNGTTGLKTWEAALMLTDWALCHKQVFQKKRILELGSGVGLTGISIAKLCGPAETVLTDCHEEVLRTICQNIEINFPTSAKEETIEETYYRNGETSVGVRTLDWNFIADLPSEVIPDVVIGADIIYDPSILQPLCNAFDVLCSRNSNLTIYIQSVIRNEETFLMFTELLEKMEFQSESIEQKKCVYMHWDTETDRKLLKINKKVS